jgi:hypothetical protein
MSRFKRADITDLMVCEAVRDAKGTNEWPYELLARQTGVPEKVCFRAMERAFDHGLLDYGVSLRSGWLTEAGEVLLKESET